MVQIPGEYFDEVFDDPEVNNLKQMILKYDPSGELGNLIAAYGSTVLEKTYYKTMGINLSNHH